MHLSIIAQRYGIVTELDTAPITGPCSSIDLRVMTGAPVGTPDETREVPAGVFRVAVLQSVAGMLPVGEIRIMLAGREVSIVGEPTGRPVVELTLVQLRAASESASYLRQLQAWVRG